MARVSQAALTLMSFGFSFGAPQTPLMNLPRTNRFCRKTSSVAVYDVGLLCRQWSGGCLIDVDFDVFTLGSTRLAIANAEHIEDDRVLGG
jgi:hypothetical protein